MDRDMVNLLHHGYHRKAIDWGAAKRFLHCDEDTRPPVEAFLTSDERAVDKPLKTFIKAVEDQMKTVPGPNLMFGFPIADKPRKPGQKRAAFVAIPFKLKGFRDVKRRILNAANKKNFKCKVPDESRAPASIVDDIWRSIRRAEVVVAELTGANPNVLYELGLAHALGKEVIAISQDDTALPFDITTLRRTTYDLEHLAQLEKDIAEAFGAVAARYKFDHGDFKY